MGQYHYTVNLDKREFLNPHKLGDGLKLWEQLNSQAGTMVALHILLACSNGRGGGDIEENPLVGRWAGDHIAVIGDYAEDDDLAPEHEADLISNLCRTEEGRQETVNYWRELAKEGKGWNEKADRLARATLYRDISDDILPLVEQACDVKITGDGWREKTATRAMKPDMVITAKP